MKKLFIGLAFLGLLMLANPTTVKAENQECSTVTIHCTNGFSFYAIVCTYKDLQTWWCIYCNHCEE